MGWQPGRGSGAGKGPDRSPSVPGGPTPVRDPRLAGFASAEGRDALVPSGRLALVADEVSGPGRRCPGASDDELIGLLRAWAAIESWAAGAKLGVIAELIRRDGAPRDGGRHGDLPDDWSASLRHELTLALACSVQSAETTAWLAREQQARLPGIGALLSDGTLTLPKARAITETFRYLGNSDAARAEALILGQLTGKTYTQVLRLAEQAALTADPELAARRREHAQKKDARVTFLREQAGTAALAGRDLPPDEALAAMASVSARAQQYEDSGAFGDTRMDVLRAYAYLDLLNGVTAENRIAYAEAQDEAAEALAWAEARAQADAQAEAQARARAQAEARAETEAGARAKAARDAAQNGGRTESRGKPESGAASDAAAGTSASPAPDADTPGMASNPAGGDDAPAGPHECRCGQCDGDCGDPGEHDDGDDDGRDGRENGDDGKHGDDGDDGKHGDDGEPGGGSGPGGPGPDSGPGPGAPSAGRALQRRPPDLAVPLLTLLGLAERPGEIQGFGLLDPALARQMAAAAAASPHTTVCATVTSPEGYATGHGCARPDRSPPPSHAATSRRAAPGALPARLNLTIPATALAILANGALAGSSGRDGPWAFRLRGGPGPPTAADGPDGHGTWTLNLPGGQRLTVRLDPVPTFTCDHRYETHGYQPTGKLRHLVQVRDGTCTFPSCNRHARDSDFEHALPYDKGGKTCACNTGARSRACHRVKQTAGWNVTQPQPGWHQWTTPADRVYVQEPKRYPA